MTTQSKLECCDAFIMYMSTVNNVSITLAMFSLSAIKAAFSLESIFLLGLGRFFLSAAMVKINALLFFVGQSEPVYKSVFLIYFHGEQLKDKVYKICNGFGVTLYNCPESSEERHFLKNSINSRRKDIRVVSR